MIGETVKAISPETLVNIFAEVSNCKAQFLRSQVVLDGVCSVASEEIRMDAWGIDVVLTASQKGLGAPPGLSIVAASQAALAVAQNRKTPVTSYYASWKKWLPIMNAYETGKPMYFATPPVNLIRAYYTSLKQITQSAPSV